MFSSVLCYFFQREVFECNNFSENYHPMFEVILDINSKEVRLGILDKTESGKEVWNRRRIFLTGRHKTVRDEIQKKKQKSK